MKMTNMKISHQLRLGLSLILILVAGLGLLAWRQTDLLRQQTHSIYHHSLEVRRAVGTLKADILMIHWGMDDIFAHNQPARAPQLIRIIEHHEVSAREQLAVLFDRYLGPRGDVEQVLHTFQQCQTNRQEVIRLLQAGDRIRAQAINIHQDSGPESVHLAEVMAQLHALDDFSRSNADQLYQDAIIQQETLTRQLILIAGGILLLTLLVAWRLLHNIRTPLKHLTATTEQFRQGRLNARSAYTSNNEFGVLSSAFNIMAEAMEAQMALKARAAQIAAVMLQETEARSFCRELLKTLLAHTGSQVGAIYLLNQKQTRFKHFESIGLTAGARTSFSASGREGEFGAALASRRMQRITEIPAATRFSFTAVSGSFIPREIITLPLLDGQTTVAVISLASLHAYTPAAIQLLESIENTLTARMNGVLAYQAQRALAERLEQQNRALDVSKQELEAHATELKSLNQQLEFQNQELEAQTTELTAMNTELEVQKCQLDEASRHKSAFLANMSHELRTPLNSVIALSGVLQRRLVNTIAQDEYGYLDVIGRNGRHLLTLINDILEFSRIEAGREEVSLAPLDLPKLVAEVLEMLELQAREKDVALHNQVNAEIPALYSDAAKIRHILQNLLGNALKFTESGRVTISARQVQHRLLVTVSDTGIGIPPEQLSAIFDEFHQADDTMARKYGGTGLGLAIAKKYAAMLQADLSVESTPGQGSSFTLEMPFTPASAPGSAQEAALLVTSDQPVSADPARLLVVEDNPSAIIQMTDILTHSGYQVRVAPNGREALTQIQADPPDVVILDLMMPEMDGFEVLKTLRESEPGANLPVLILTARHVSKAELAFLKGNNISQLIQKGDISKTALLEAIARLAAPIAKSKEGKA